MQALLPLNFPTKLFTFEFDEDKLLNNYIWLKYYMYYNIYSAENSLMLFILKLDTCPCERSIF